MNKTDRLSLQLAEAVLSRAIGFWFPTYGERELALRIQDSLRPPKRSPSAKLKGPTRKTEKRAKAAKHGKDWEAIKLAVLERARLDSGGKCELGCGREINDPHHLISGSGKRIPNERYNTVIAICRHEHDLYEAGDVVTLDAVHSWAARHQYSVAMDEVERRIERIVRVRAQTAGGAK